MREVAMDAHTSSGRGWPTAALYVLLVLLLVACTPLSSPPKTAAPVATSGPITDRLAEPPLPTNPTQYEQGRHLYWLNCMPCHGDSGQGLTDEFRSLWEEDHQDCWARGCHAGRAGDEGFPLPRTIPPLLSTTSDLASFSTTAALYEYLHNSHPPQRPGVLAESDCWALTVYLLVENGCLPAGQEAGP
jgi:hypothetical protein